MPHAKKIFLFAILLLLGLAIRNNWYASAVEPCPHPRFITNHLCTDCYTLTDAADFSKYRPRPTWTNTVFLGRPSFEVKTYKSDRCGNIDPVKVAVCSKTDPVASNPYTCTWLGQRCLGEHAISSGHLYYGDIKCF